MKKQYETKKKNGTFKSSKKEDIFASLLEQNNIIYERQYRSDLYPFNCDFYIPKLDLYIELNLYLTHGPGPFDFCNLNHLNYLDWLKLNGGIRYKKEKRKNLYFNTIDTWTERDVKKLNIAKKNNLNYIMVYNEKEFDSIVKDIICQF